MTFFNFLINKIIDKYTESHLNMDFKIMLIIKNEMKLDFKPLQLESTVN